MKKGVLFILVLILLLISAFSAFSLICLDKTSNYMKAVLTGDKETKDKILRKYSLCQKALPLKEINAHLVKNRLIILLQNNTEIRPSGGFMGSFITLDFEEGVLVNFALNDIYTPDGQVTGYIESPYPLIQAFRNGEYRLRNSNWDINFIDAASTINWFFEKGGITDIDEIVAINLSTIEKIVKIVEPIKVHDFNEELTSDNFYQVTQGYSETEFFPGSRQKKNFLSAVAKAMSQTLANLSPFQKLKIINSLAKDFLNNEILIWSKRDLSYISPLLQKDSYLVPHSVDYIYPVESNLGANKANCCIERSIEINSQEIENYYQTEVVQTWENRNENSTPNPPLSYGGDYKNYHRIAIPVDAQIKEISINSRVLTFEENRDILMLPDPQEDNSYSLIKKGKYQVVGFWVITPVGKTSKAQIKYTLPNKNKYSLVIQKQPGIESLPYLVDLSKKIHKGILNKSSLSF